MKQQHWVTPKDKLRLLDAFLKLLVGDAQVSFEGDLSRCDFSGLEEYKISPFGELHRINTEPGSDYAAYALDGDSIEVIARWLVNPDCAIEAIDHIQIQKEGALQVLIGDNFDDECVSVGPLVSVEILERLLSEGIISGYETDAEAKAEYPWFSHDAKA